VWVDQMTHNNFIMKTDIIAPMIDFLKEAKVFDN
jgi:hypothetical protein